MTCGGGTLTFFVVWVAGASWFFFCNHRTYRDRREIAAIIFAARDWRMRAKLFERVSYGRHLAHRFFVLDPLKLYSPRIFGEVDK